MGMLTVRTTVMKPTAQVLAIVFVDRESLNVTTVNVCHTRLSAMDAYTVQIKVIEIIACPSRVVLNSSDIVYQPAGVILSLLVVMEGDLVPTEVMSGTAIAPLRSFGVKTIAHA